MKRISKILSVLMIAVMLFSMAALPVSAWDADTSATIKYIFKDLDGNVITEAEKGEQVELFVVLNWDKKVFNFQGTFKWDVNALTLVRKNGKLDPITGAGQTYTLLGDFAVANKVNLTEADGDMYYEDDNDMMNGYYTTYGAGTKTFNHDCDMGSDWDAATTAQYQAYTYIFQSNIDGTTQQILVDTDGKDLEFCKMRFLVNADTELSEAIISNDAAFATMNYIDVTADQSLYFANHASVGLTTYIPNTPSTTLKIGVTAPAYDLFHVQNQYRPNGDNYDIGVKFGFKAEDIAIAFNEKGTSTNVTAVGADIYVGEDKVDGVFESQYVYDINGDESEFHYRVIIEGLAKADDTKYTIKPYVVIDGNKVLGEEVTVSAAAIVPQA